MSSPIDKLEAHNCDDIKLTFNEAHLAHESFSSLHRLICEPGAVWADFHILVRPLESIIIKDVYTVSVTAF